VYLSGLPYRAARFNFQHGSDVTHSDDRVIESGLPETQIDPALFSSLQFQIHQVQEHLFVGPVLLLDLFQSFCDIVSEALELEFVAFFDDLGGHVCFSFRV